jgi:NADH-quinone oxidoreductase subunit L
MDAATEEHAHESPAVVTVPLILLAIPSICAGFLIDKLVFDGYFAESIKVLPVHDTVGRVDEHYEGIGPFIAHGLASLPFLFTVAGLALAWVFYLRAPELPDRMRARFNTLYRVLINKYYVDEFNERVFAAGARRLGNLLWRVGDVLLIDGLAVNGTARVVGWCSAVIRQIQSGYVYHYAFAMILGLFFLITFFLHR